MLSTGSWQRFVREPSSCARPKPETTHLLPKPPPIPPIVAHPKNTHKGQPPKILCLLLCYEQSLALLPKDVAPLTKSYWLQDLAPEVLWRTIADRSCAWKIKFPTNSLFLFLKGKVKETLTKMTHRFCVTLLTWSQDL